LLLIAEFDAREGWGVQGAKSCVHWLSWICGISPRSAREHVRVARALGAAPLITEAFGRGELSYCKVRALTRVAEPETEAELLEIARHASGAALEKLVRGYAGALSATLDVARQVAERRCLHYEWQEDGTLRIDGRLTPEDGALLLNALAASDVPPADDAAMTRADALIAMARAALTSGDAARPGGDPTEVVVHVDVETLAADTVRCQSRLLDGPAIAPETARRLACDAAVVRIVEQDGRPLSVGRRTRTIPPALRRALRSRDVGCRFPGCDHTRFLHAHHIHHWAHGGTTDLGNLVQLCSFHHRLVHEGGYVVECSGPKGESVRFRRPDGAPIPAVPRRRDCSGPGLERQHRSAGLAMDAETCRPRSPGDRLDYGIAVEVMLGRLRR
jgi:hypothetical protein